MTTYLVSDLHQHWLKYGKQPVPLFSSDEYQATKAQKLQVLALTETETETATELPHTAERVIEPQQNAEAHSVFIPVAQTTAIPTESITSQTAWTLPEISWPHIAIPSLPSVPRFKTPQFSVPTISLPAIALPHIQLPAISWEKALKWGGNLAYAGAIALFVMFFTPIIVIESQQHWKTLSARIAAVQLQSHQTITNPEPTPTPEPEIRTVEDYFSINIPRLQIASRVIPNVSASNTKEYEEALKIGVAHASGTGLPGATESNKTIYLFAHSTNNTFNIQRYNAQFYALKDSVQGDEIQVRYWGEDYIYEVQEVKIVDANDTSFLEVQHDQEKLILQTCYPPGTTWKRLVVIATRKNL